MNLRKYGKSPFSIIVVHGGPGAAGEMEPLAKELAKNYGVLEPFQTKTSVSEQIEELKNVIKKSSHAPVILIGWSWGAWLSYLTTAKYPGLVKKLILVSSGPFKEKYSQQIMPLRLSRLSDKDRVIFDKTVSRLPQTKEKEKNQLFKKVGKILAKSDSYDPLKDDTQIRVDYEIYEKVWNEAAQMRKSGYLLNAGKKIACPVVAIHGDYDPHPAQGVRKPLEEILSNFKFYLLKNCGHTPWLEKEIKEKFFDTLRNEVDK